MLSVAEILEKVIIKNEKKVTYWKVKSKININVLSELFRSDSLSLGNGWHSYLLQRTLTRKATAQSYNWLITFLLQSLCSPSWLWAGILFEMRVKLVLTRILWQIISKHDEKVLNNMAKLFVSESLLHAYFVQEYSICR